MSSANTLTAVPAEITIGESVTWEKDLCNYPADEWTVTYYFRGAGSGFDIAGTPSANDPLVHAFAITPTQTGTMTAGRYDYQALAVKGSEKHVVDKRTITAIVSLAGITTTTAYDSRTKAKKILDAIDTLMLDKTALDQQKYLIATGVPGFTSQREAERIDPEKLLALRKYYAAIVRSENRRKNGSPFRTISIQFDEPS